MRVLLDTHVLLWMIGESRSLSASAIEVLADEKNELFFSPISIAEVAIKHQKDAVLMPLSSDDVRFGAEECGVQELQFDSRQAHEELTDPWSCRRSRLLRSQGWRSRSRPPCRAGRCA